MTFEKRLDAIGRFDIAGVTDPNRNLIRGVYNAGDTDDAERQLKWWEDAFGEERSRLADRIEETGARTNFPELLQPFGRAAQGLRPAFTRLSIVIAIGTFDQFARWRFVARIYTARVTHLVDQCTSIMDAANLRRSWLEALESIDPGPFRILDANLTTRHERFATGPGNATRSRANAVRALDVLRVVEELDNDRRRMIRFRDELLTKYRKQAPRGRSQSVRSSVISIQAEIDALLASLRRLDSDGRAAAAARQAKQVTAELRRAFGFPRAGGISLLEEITRCLSVKPSV